MKRFLSVLLSMCILLSALPVLAENVRGSRGSVEIVNEEIEEEEKAIEEEMGFYTDDMVYDPSEEIPFDDEVLTEAFETLHGVQNILLLGVDSRSSEISGRTDTMILLTVDVENKTIKLTSFLRDLYVEIPGKSNNRMNAAYVYGGFNLLAKTVEKNFGVKPDAYVTINLSGLSRVIDALGGVYVDVDSKKIDRVNAVIYWYNKQVLGLSNPRDGYLKKGGYQLLNGKQAESWARYRHTESDFQRSQRQRQLIQIIFKKICEMSLSDMISFAYENMDLVKTNLSIADVIKLAPAVLTMKDAEIRELRIPIDGGYSSKTVSGMAVLVPDRQKNVKALANFLNEK